VGRLARREDNVERGGGKGSRERGRAEIGKEGVA